MRGRYGEVSAPSGSSVDERKELPGSPSKADDALAENKDKENPRQVEYKEIKSPITGTFYAASTPGGPPFVSIGSIVKVQETVCIIEAMKVMNEIKADQAGKITEILVQDGEAVQASQGPNASWLGESSSSFHFSRRSLPSIGPLSVTVSGKTPPRASMSE